MSTHAFTLLEVPVDTPALPAFPAHDVDWFSNVLWETTSMFAEANDLPVMGEGFQAVYAAAERCSREVEAMAPLFCSVMGEMLAHLAHRGAIAVTVTAEGTDDGGRRVACLTADGVVTALGSAACMAALMLGTSLLSGQPLTASPDEAIVGLPVTVRGGAL